MAKSDLWRRLAAVEDCLISPLDRRIEQLSPTDRAAYAAWVQRCIDHFNAYTGHSYFGDWIDGRIRRPELPRHIERQLFPAMPVFLTTDTDADAADKWRRMMEGTSR